LHILQLTFEFFRKNTSHGLSLSLVPDLRQLKILIHPVKYSIVYPPADLRILSGKYSPHLGLNFSQFPFKGIRSYEYKGCHSPRVFSLWSIIGINSHRWCEAVPDLCAAGKQLEDINTFQDSGILKDSAVHLVLFPRHGLMDE
jgi:hypothetical protein